MRIIPDASTLTDFERIGLHHEVNLADGHAYHDHFREYGHIIGKLPEIWEKSTLQSIPEVENTFFRVFADLSGCKSLFCYPNFKICPTASNSIDITAAILRQLDVDVTLVEPTFDNLALLLKRRGIKLKPVSANDLIANANKLGDLDALDGASALFLVNPNNPDGVVFDQRTFQSIVDFCNKNGLILIVDNSFRFFNRHPFDDYEYLISSGVSFLSFEDTGKVFPTQDMKASLIITSPDLWALLDEIYNEVYLCVSNFSLNVISEYMKVTKDASLLSRLWELIDRRRALIYSTIDGTGLVGAPEANNSQLGLIWLDCSNLGRDRDVIKNFSESGLLALPGNHFYWSGNKNPVREDRIRFSLLKPETVFNSAVGKLNQIRIEVLAESSRVL